VLPEGRNKKNREQGKTDGVAPQKMWVPRKSITATTVLPKAVLKTKGRKKGGKNWEEKGKKEAKKQEGVPGNRIKKHYSIKLWN